jgi:hypothetical protein
MRVRLPLDIFIGVTFASIATAAAAQNPADPDLKIVVRDVVKTGTGGTGLARAYQGRDRGPEQTERFSRKVRVERDGRVSIQNIAGEITVTGGSGDEMSIEAVKRTRGDRGELAAVQIIVDDRAGRVDVRTQHDRFGRNNNDRVSVDYTISVPGGVAVDVKSISGNVKVSNVQGAVRAESVSGNVTTAGTPRLEMAKSVSGDVVLTDAGADADLSAGSVSGNIRHPDQRDVRATRDQIGQRQPRVLGDAGAQRTLRHQHALGQRAPRAHRVHRLRADCQHVQRIDSIRVSSDHRRRSRPRSGQRQPPARRERPVDPRDLRRRQRCADHPDLQRGHRDRETLRSARGLRSSTAMRRPGSGLV